MRDQKYYPFIVTVKLKWIYNELVMTTVIAVQKMVKMNVYCKGYDEDTFNPLEARSFLASWMS